jgi:hypothetical protein
LFGETSIICDDESGDELFCAPFDVQHDVPYGALSCVGGRGEQFPLVTAGHKSGIVPKPHRGRNTQLPLRAVGQKPLPALQQQLSQQSKTIRVKNFVDPLCLLL